MTAILLTKLPFLAVIAAAATAGARPAAEARAGGPTVQLGDRAVLLFSSEAASLAVAKVGDDTISVRDFGQLLADTHTDHAGAAPGQRDFRPALDRLIDMRLITLEARAMGMDELPEVKKSLAEFKVSSLRQLVRGRVARSVKMDRQAVERLYRDSVRQWKVQSVLFAQEVEAAGFAANASAASFGESTARLVKEGKAKSRVEGQVFGRSQAQPAVIAAVEKLKPGEVSVPVKLPDGFAVLLLEEVRYPEDPAERAEAENTVMTPLRASALRAYYQDLQKKYAKVDEKLLRALDYETKGATARLAKDRRVLAHIAGEAPITVADLTADLQTQFFHGMDQAVKDKKINRKKMVYFEQLLTARLFDKAARVQRLAESDDYRRGVAEFERSLLFGTFVERAIVPEVKVTETDARAYYDGHQNEFRSPDMYKLETLAFARPADAQAACKKLQGGTDVKWLKGNAENQLDPAKRSIQIDGTSVTATSLPEPLARILSNAKPGDCRIYARAEGECYAVLVGGRTESQVQPFAEARPRIDPKLFQEKLAASISDWAKKLRKGYEVKVFITGLGV